MNVEPHAHGFNGEVCRACGHIEQFGAFLAQQADARLAPEHIDAQGEEVVQKS